MRDLSALRQRVEEWRALEARAQELDELLSLAVEDNDTSLADSFSEEYAGIVRTVKDLEFKLVLSGEYDGRSAIVAFHTGAGGVDSQDWVRMLMRMYLRWSERRGFERDVLDVSPGDEGGVKSSVIQITGPNAYGYLRAERGVHRLVRLLAL